MTSIAAKITGQFFSEKKLWAFVLLLSSLISPISSLAQGVHFSQFYNSPLLVNPANAGLLPAGDWRVGAAYRTQWRTVPVPYSTTSVFADFQIAPNSDGSSWLGLGGAFFSDKAGNGDLKLSRSEFFAAYHLGTSYTSRLSFGLNGGYNARTVDFAKLTFDSQWDGFNFNTSLPNAEGGYTGRASYWDVGAGLSYAYFPSDAFYVQASAGVAHLNRPAESFYNGENRIGMRPSATIDAQILVNGGFIVNPNIYYTRQKGAQQTVVGSIFRWNILGTGRGSQQFILGTHYRWKDAVIASVGYQLGGLRVTTSYDVTTSSLGLYNGRAGALEINLLYEGVYGDANKHPKGMGCPRF